MIIYIFFDYISMQKKKNFFVHISFVLCSLQIFFSGVGSSK